MATRRAITAPIAAADGDAADDQAEGERRPARPGSRGWPASCPPRWPCRSCRCGCPPGWWSGVDRPRSARMKRTPGDEVEDGREVGVHLASCPPPRSATSAFFLYMASIRWVTRKPPKMLTAAKAAATAPAPLEIRTLPVSSPPRPLRRGGQQGADDDHRGDGVGHRHQRRVQRRRHAPDHVVADEDRQHEDRQAEDGGIDGFHRSSLRCQALSAGWTTAPPWVTRAAFRISSS